MPIKANIIGAENLDRSLRQAGADLADVKQLHVLIATELANRGRPYAPSLTGALEGTIRPTGTKAAGVVRAGGSSVPYAGVQEFGWPARNIPPQPFLTRALEEGQEDYLEMWQKEAERILDKVEGAPAGLGGF